MPPRPAGTASASGGVSAEPAPAPAAPRPLDARQERLRSRFRGCLLGGALGDALGAPVEFLSLAQIRAKYGPRGLEQMEPSAYGPPGRITDDTQMTLFTAEGLIRAWVRGKARGIGNPPSEVHHAYLRWLHTQGETWRGAKDWDSGKPWQPDGWLVTERFLHARRAPGNTCLSALRATEQFGQPAQNDSKGCGGVMRIAPVGLMSNAGTGSEPTEIEGIFRLAVEIAALTHGHPTGQLPAGVLAATIHAMVHHGRELPRALDEATRILVRWPHHEETLAALRAARALAERGDPTPEKLETLGEGGWVAEWALAIGVYAALCHPNDLPAALLLAVNHSGDTDSTGAICGNLLGAVLGESVLPGEWLQVLDGREVIERLAGNLHAEDQNLRPAEGFYDQAFAVDGSEIFAGRLPSNGYGEWCRRFPGS